MDNAARVTNKGGAKRPSNLGTIAVKPSLAKYLQDEDCIEKTGLRDMTWLYVGCGIVFF
jgi:hypothetical protein